MMATTSSANASSTGQHVEISVALVGNPNTGKTTTFNALAGVRQRVGNYPGVTVEKKVGFARWGNVRLRVVDLPGTYSLAPRSIDEMVAVDVLLGRRDDEPMPDVVVSVVDASNLERNLYLVSQILELGLPVVLALNMTDVAEQQGHKIDSKKLSRKLGIPVVELQAHRRRGIDELKAAIVAAAQASPPEPANPLPPAFQSEVERLNRLLRSSSESNNGHAPGGAPLPRYLLERLLLDTSGYLQRSLLPGEFMRPAADAIEAARKRLAEQGLPVPAVEAMARYAWVSKMLEGTVDRPRQRLLTLSDRVDRVLTHRVVGTLFFVLVMALMFQSVFQWAVPAMDAIDAGVGVVGNWIESHMAEGTLRSLLVDGVIAGVGGVLVFLPQIFILFFFIGILEDCGYMARAAYLMDKLMSRVGLSGKSFIPLLSSFACAIPGIMAARVIENRRDRLTTILVAPLMTCSARLPVYTVLIAAFVPQRSMLGGLVGLQGLTLAAMYVLGIVMAVTVALVLKKTLFRGATPPFVMELPSYKWPSPMTVISRMIERGWAFVRRAGTVILAVSIVVWAALYFPHDKARVETPFAKQQSRLTSALEQLDADDPRRERIAAELREVENEILSEYSRQSYLGRLGHAIEPVVRPLGWDWRIGCAVLASFPAREVVIATLGVIYNLGEELDPTDREAATRLQTALRSATWDDTGQPVFNVPVALSIMVFFALCAQCASTLVVIQRETGRWSWSLFTFVYMTTLAYLAAWITYRTGMWLLG